MLSTHVFDRPFKCSAVPCFAFCAANFVDDLVFRRCVLISAHLPCESTGLGQLSGTWHAFLEEFARYEADRSIQQCAFFAGDLNVEFLMSRDEDAVCYADSAKPQLAMPAESFLGEISSLEISRRSRRCGQDRVKKAFFVKSLA